MNISDNKKFDAVIIGSGIGGLISALILSKNSMKVAVFEKHHILGGNLQSFVRKKVKFDTGMHYFGATEEGGFISNLLKYIDVNVDNCFTDFENGIFDTIIYNSKKYNFPAGIKNFKNFLLLNFPSEDKAIETYINLLVKVYKNVSPKNIYNNIFENKLYYTGTKEYLDSISNNSDFKNVLAGNSFLYDTSGGNSSIYAHAVIMSSFIFGAKKFANNSSDFVDILANKIIESGGKIFKRTEINALNSADGKIVSCKTFDGNIFYADNFISAVHPAITINLAEKGAFKKSYINRISSLKQTKGAFVIYISFKDKSFKYFDSNLYFCNTKNSWDFFKSSDKNFPSNFFFTTPLSGREGDYTNSAVILTLMDFEEFAEWENTNHKTRPENYRIFKNEIAQKIFNSVEKHIPGFNNSVDKYYTSSPLTLRDYTGTVNGGIYGVERNCENVEESYIPVSTKISNLFLTGQNVNFHGMLGVSISSVLTCTAVLKKKIDF